jgi:acyl carrier protein
MQDLSRPQDLIELLKTEGLLRPGIDCVEADSSLREDLGFDSFAFVEFNVILIEHGVELEESDWADIRTVRDVCYHVDYRRAQSPP